MDHVLIHDVTRFSLVPVPVRIWFWIQTLCRKHPNENKLTRSQKVRDPIETSTGT